MNTPPRTPDETDFDVADGSRRYAAGVASDYIAHAPAALRRGTKVVLCVRVSAWQQEAEGNLARAASDLMAQVGRFGVEIVYVHPVVASGYDPTWVIPAVCRARAEGAVLVAESTDRFVRPPFYTKKNQDARARACDLDQLRWHSDGVPLVTVVHPDATPAQVRAHQTRRGRRAREAGAKKQRREECLPVVAAFARAGHGPREIHRRTGIPLTTIVGWLDRLRRGCTDFPAGVAAETQKPPESRGNSA